MTWAFCRRGPQAYLLILPLTLPLGRARAGQRARRGEGLGHATPLPPPPPKVITSLCQWQGAPPAGRPVAPPPPPNGGDGGRPQIPLAGQRGACRGAAVGAGGGTQGVHRDAIGGPTGQGRARLGSRPKRRVEGARRAAQGVVASGGGGSCSKSPLLGATPGALGTPPAAAWAGELGSDLVSTDSALHAAVLHKWGAPLQGGGVNSRIGPYPQPLDLCT